jgi:glycosyltransferase involved in cell wall biosynthesis
LPTADALTLLDETGRALPLQTSALAHWSDGTVKWALLDSLLLAEHGSRLRLEIRPGVGPDRPGRSAVHVRQARDETVVDTGAAVFHVGHKTLQPLARVVLGGIDVLDTAASRVVLTDAADREETPPVAAVTVEADGPVRATIRLEGAFRGKVRARFVARLCFFAGTGLVRVRLTAHNPRRAHHRGGLWDLGDRGSMFFRDLSLELALRSEAAPRTTWSAELDQTPGAASGVPLEIYQDSSGGANWRSTNHVNRYGKVPCSFRGYRVRIGNQEHRGLRASPLLVLAGDHGSVSVGFPDFWQQFPKAVEALDGRLRVRLFPRQFGDSFELQGGEQKMHVLWLDFTAATPSPASPLEWVHRPVRVHAAPAWYGISGAVPFLAPIAEGSRSPMDALLHGAVEGGDSFIAGREIIDEYGWRHYGDVYADHEAVYYKGSPPVVSHYNNQYDVLYGTILQYLRTGDLRWVDVFDPLARHVIDIDIYHTQRDRPAYNGGLFWHTDHYRDAATSTHRGYSRANRPAGGQYGGGPCDEHNYTTGLLHYYYLTGCPAARDAIVMLADWVISMDDGSRTVFGLVDGGPTGLASSTTERTYHGPGRGCGNSVNALLDGWLATGWHVYLHKAEALIRRCIHPADDLSTRDLLKVEMRWSYTVFLAVLARYLDLKAEAGELDYGYAYARTSLLCYANWMLDHEEPYFAHPEKLEYPTETWAAQEFRKANVLRLAAAHVDEPLRARLLRRADELADRGWDDLHRCQPSVTARARAILFVEGTRDRHFRARGVAPAPAAVGTYDFGRPAPFVPQRHRVLARLTSPPGVAGAVVRLADPRNWRRFLSWRDGVSGERAPSAVSGRQATVCQLLHSLKVGGAEVLAARLARQFDSACRVLFVCLDELGTLGQQLRDEGFRVEVLGRRPGVDWRCVLRLARVLRREQVDLVHAHQYTPFFYAAAARLLYPYPAIVLTEHGRHHPDYPRPKRRLANRLFLQRRDRVVAVGEAVRQALVANDGFPAERVGVVYNGIDLTPFTGDTAARAAARQDLGLGADDLVLIQVARLDAIKDHATALRALKRVVGRRPDARLVLVGEGPEEAHIRRFVRENRLEPNVRMLGLRQDVARLLPSADVFLLTSVSEGIPLTVIEAMAAGLPIVSTRVGGVPEVVVERQTGFLAPAGDSAALAATVCQLADDPVLRAEMGRRGRRRAEALFSERLMHTRYDQLYREMLGD